MRKLVLIVAAAAMLSACGQSSAPTVSSQAAVDPPAMLALGLSYTWPTGDTIMVSNPQRHQGFISLDVAITNGGHAPISVGTIDSPIMLNVDANNVHLLPTEVREPGFETPSGYIIPGQTLRYRAAYELPTTNPAALQISASGTMGDPTRPVVIYQGSV